MIKKIACLLAFVAIGGVAAARPYHLHHRWSNPPGRVGGRGTNWANPRGPLGGPGWGRHWRDNDNNPPGRTGGRGTNWENKPGSRGGPGASPDRISWRR